MTLVLNLGGVVFLLAVGFVAGVTCEIMARRLCKHIVTRSTR